MSAALRCPRCDGPLRTTRMDTIELRDVRGVLGFVFRHKGGRQVTPAHFAVSCQRCPFGLSGSWERVAAAFGLVIASAEEGVR